MEDNIASSMTTDVFEEQARYELATKGQRLINYVVDIVVNYFFLYKLLDIATGLAHKGAKADMAYVNAHQTEIMVYAMAGLPVMYALIEGLSKGRSLGKFLTGTVAVRKDLSPIRGTDAVLRSLLRIIPVDSISGLFGAPLHDKWSGTMVVKKNSVVF